MDRKPPSRRRSPDTLTLKLGGWFEAHATGLGVVAIPIVVLVLTLAMGVKFFFGA
jgi:hypothetical protein